MKKALRGALILAVASLAAFAMSTVAHASGILILGGSTSPDAAELAVQSVLEGFGQTNVQIGDSISTFDGTGLSGFSAVVLLDGDGTAYGYDMPTGGQTALVNFVNAGGGLVTGEWSNWGYANAGSLSTLEAAFPVVPSTTFDYNSPLTYNVTVTNSVLDNGLPSSFTFTADDDGGTETYFVVKGGATEYLSATGSSFDPTGGVIGWSYGSGKVVSFSTLIGTSELGDSDYAQLLDNAVNFTSGVSAVPEPSAWWAGLGLLVVLFVRRLRKLMAQADAPGSI